MIKTIFCIVVATFVLCGCQSNKWSIAQTSMGFERSGEYIEKKNSILIDTGTGETWMLWTGKPTGGPGNYVWMKLPKGL